MDTSERRTVLMTPCRWCGASINEECTAGGKAFTPITTLEGGFHDTRVRDSLGRPAHVVGSSALTTEPDHDQEPVPVGAGVERPW